MNGLITGLAGFVAQAIVVALAVLVGAGSIDLTQLQGGGEVVRLLVTAIGVLALAVVLLIPRWRH